MLKEQNRKVFFLIFQNLTVILLILIFFQKSICAQDSILYKPITISFKKLTVAEALSQISIKTKYYFTFDSETFDANKIISFTFKNQALKNCLNQIIGKPELYYTVIDNHIVINKKSLVNLHKVLVNDSTIKNIELQGVIVDKESTQPLAYATVGVENYNIGSVSNADGVFVLKIPKQLVNKNLCISYIGYFNTCIPIEQLYNNNLTIELQRNYISVQEVIIRSTEPKAIIRAANSKIKDNYSSVPVYLTTFYREWVKQKDKFMFFAEAVLKQYKPSYLNMYDSDQIKVLKSRNFHDLSNTDTVRLRLKSGLYASSALDFVKNKLDFLDEKSFHFYNYNMVDIVTYNNHSAYVIEFEQKKNVKEALYKGQIYVDIDSLAYIGAEFSLNPIRISKAHLRFIVKKQRNLKLRIKHADYRVSYHEVNGTYYLRHVKGELEIRVKKKRKLFATTFIISFETAICNIDTINVKRFKRKESDKLNTIFVDDIREYDNSFWEDYNFIKPDDNWKEAVKKLQLKLKQESLVN